MNENMPPDPDTYEDRCDLLLIKARVAGYTYASFQDVVRHARDRSHKYMVTPVSDHDWAEHVDELEAEWEAWMDDQERRQHGKS